MRMILGAAMVAASASTAVLAPGDGLAAASCETIVTAVPVAPGSLCPGSASVAVVPDTALMWCYQVRNTGSGVIGRATVADAVFGPLAGSLGDIAPGDTSAPLAYSAGREVVVGAHSAQGSARTGSGASVNCSPGEVDVLPASPGIAVDLTATVDQCPGDNELTVERDTDVTWCYAVSNTDGVTTLTGIEVTDSQFGPDPVGAIASLAPGSTQVLTASRPMVTHQTESFATATGTPVFGAQTFPPVSARDSASVAVQQ